MDDDQQFCLRWNNHQSTLVAVFDTLLENGTLVDCTLAAEGKYLNAHKVVLSACSPYFETLLSKHFDKHPIVVLKDVKFQELKAMMDYMYRGEVNISQDQLGALLKAAESLQIKGLSDNKRGETERKPVLAPKSPPAAAAPAQTALPKVQGLTIEQRGREEGREGSTSPGPRKKKRMRRKSEEMDNHHDASNSSESHSLPAAHTTAPALLPAISKMSADVPEPVETKSEILTRHKQQQPQPDDHTPQTQQQLPILKEKIETHTELMLEPKAEYVEEMNEDSIEDLTLDDDDLSNMEQMDDQAGPSHGNAGEGSSQGFGGWHMGNQSQDEVFLAAQEAVGAHRDSQAWQLHTKQRFTCDQCGRSYKHRTNLCNHKREECGKPPSHFCPLCKKGFKKKQHLQRHLTVHNDVDLASQDPDSDVMKQLMPYLMRQDSVKLESMPNFNVLPKVENAFARTSSFQPLSTFPKNVFQLPGMPYSSPMYYFPLPPTQSSTHSSIAEVNNDSGTSEALQSSDQTSESTSLIIENYAPIQ